MSEFPPEIEIEIESEISQELEEDKLWASFMEFRKDWLRELTHDDMVGLFGDANTEEMIHEKRDGFLREVRGVYHSLIEKDLMFPDDKTCHNMIEFHVIVTNIQDSALILTRFLRIKKDSSTFTRRVFNWYTNMDQEVELNIGDREEIILNTFREPLIKHLFSSRDQLDNYFKKYAPRAVRFLDGFADSYLVRINRDEDLIPRTLTSFTGIRIKIREEPREEGGEPSIRRISMADLIGDNLEFIPTFTRKVFKPLGRELQEGEFNTWPGFKFNPVENINMELVNPFINHITQVWASGNLDHANYILTWMATILTRPWEKTGIALLVCGKKGTGKSMISDFFIHHLVGNGLGWMAPELSQMTMDFNSHLENKLVIGIQEVGYGSVKTYSQEYNRLKSLITDPKISIHPKYELVREVTNFSNILLHSNSGLPLEGDDDRRFAVFQTSEEKVGDLEYFRNLKENLKPENANHIGTYLLNIPHLMVDLEKIPKTHIREEIIESSEPPPIRFIRELREMEEIPPHLTSIPNYPNHVSIDDLYKHYDLWRSQNGEPAISKMKFSKTIAHICPSERKYHPINKNYIRMCQVREKKSVE